ncbi:MAG TPA: succinate dehydrogenase, cytochrome b556 subunit [Rhizobiaceae bacterium]|nr:succinate dehydrogenase, cytochrome b556 subunit [Rhizobiaceae bacterium]
MSKSTATHATHRNRPLSPHLQVYRLIPTMLMSIMHRITGGALYFGMLLIAWWLIAASTSEEWFRNAQWILGSWIGILILVGFSWALFFHLLGGLRHLLWDTGYAMEKHTATRLAQATMIGSFILTALLWGVIYFVTA